MSEPNETEMRPLDEGAEGAARPDGIEPTPVSTERIHLEVPAPDLSDAEGPLDAIEGPEGAAATSELAASSPTSDAAAGSPDGVAVSATSESAVVSATLEDTREDSESVAVIATASEASATPEDAEPAIEASAAPAAATAEDTGAESEGSEGAGVIAAASESSAMPEDAEPAIEASVAPAAATVEHTGDASESPEGAAVTAGDTSAAAEDEVEQAPLVSPQEAARAEFEVTVAFGRVRSLLAERCGSALGRSVVDRMKPLFEAEGVRTCLEQTMEMHGLVGQGGRLPLGAVHDASGMLRRALDNTRPLGERELLKVQETLEAAGELRKRIERQSDSLPRLASLAAHLEALPELTKSIRKTLHGDGSVRDDASPRLFKLRRKLESLRGDVENKIVQIAREPSVARVLQNSHPTIRSGRHVLAVKAEQRRQVKGLLHDRSKTAATVFIEPESIIAAGNKLQDLSYDESAEVTRVLWARTREVADHYAALEATTRTLGWLDFTHAKSALGRRYRLSCAELSEGKVELRELRHLLLLEQSREGEIRGESALEVVSSNLRLGEDYDMLVVTGPNTGGKTVLLKALGLAVLMHQCGMPIPAAPGSKLPVFTGLFADIGDGQSIDHNLSTFSAHMTRLRSFLEHAAGGSLVLIDELAAGTDPLEGAALARAALERLISSGAQAMITTHLGSLKDFAFSHARAENGAMSFDSETLTPTHALYIGQPGTSNALEIAARLELPEDVVARARELLAGEDTRAQDLIGEIQKVRLANEKTRENILAAERAAEQRVTDLAQQTTQLEGLKTTVQREADLAMTERFRNLKDTIRESVYELRGENSFVVETTKALVEKIDELLYHTPHEVKRRNFAEKLQKGDEIHVISLNKVCRIEKINKRKREITVFVGKLPFTFSMDNVSWVEGAQNRIAARFEMAQTRDAERRRRAEGSLREGRGRGRGGRGRGRGGDDDASREAGRDRAASSEGRGRRPRRRGRRRSPGGEGPSQGGASASGGGPRPPRAPRG